MSNIVEYDICLSYHDIDENNNMIVLPLDKLQDVDDTTKSCKSINLSNLNITNIYILTKYIDNNNEINPILLKIKSLSELKRYFSKPIQTKIVGTVTEIITNNSQYVVTIRTLQLEIDSYKKRTDRRLSSRPLKN